MTAQTQLLSATTLRELAADMLVAAGSDGDCARLVARSLVEANLRGVDSHGVMRLPGYVELIRAGRIRPQARPRVVADRGPTVTFDGELAFGQVVARRATRAVIQKAREYGIAMATAARIEHVGRLGEYAEMATADGLIAILLANCGPPGGLVAPYGGRTTALGTNPLAFGIPASARGSIIADFSTSATADGKVRLLLSRGLTLPPGWIIDRDGNPSVDPRDLYDGGALLPMAGHKGFGLSLFVEILGGVLAGAGCASLGDDPGNGFVIVAIDPSAFDGERDFGLVVDSVIEAIEACPPSEGFERVVVPGTPERDSVARRLAEGIPLPRPICQELVAEARRLGIPGEQLGEIEVTAR
jgi:LDH2 family malate/lactate/ureidoglycolate dehydrogenase